MSRQKLAPLSLLSLAAVVALLVAEVMSLERFRDARVCEDRSFEVSIALQKPLAAMLDAETANRGFLLTGDAAYLETFERADREIAGTFDALRRLTNDSPPQLRRLAQLERLSTSRSTLMRETVGLAKTGHSDVAIATVRDGAGRRLMDQARATASEMSGYEDGLLRTCATQMRTRYRISMSVLVVAGVALLGLGTILFGLHQDIQARRALERSLQGAVRAREQLLAIVSHDLRNPLSVVMMGATQIERMARTDGRGERLEKHAKAIIRAVERMSRLVSDLLDISKIEAGRSLGVELARRNGAELLTQSVELLEPLARAKRLALTIDVPPGAYDVDCDAERLQQVFANLIGNAIKFTPGEGTITARIARLNDEVVFSISDTGTGIPEDQVAHVFDPYWQATANRSGAGLGLSIVKAIVQAHRGRVWLESEVGSGTSFHCALPAAARVVVSPSASQPGEADLLALSKPSSIDGPNEHDRRRR